MRRSFFSKRVRGYQIHIYWGARYQPPSITTSLIWYEQLPIEEWQQTINYPATQQIWKMQSDSTMKQFLFRREGVSRMSQYRTGEECAMRALYVPSSSGNTIYTVYVYHGKVVGCNCHARRYHPHKFCKHMQAKQAELDHPSCLYCGRRTGGALVYQSCAW
jgi:hypothetical protein